MTKDKSKIIFQRLEDYYGPISAQLQFKNIYQLTIAVALSAQTTDKQVNAVTPELFKRYPDFKALSKAEKKTVEKIIHSTGFYKNKSANITKLALKVQNEHKGILPDTFDKLVSLPGIGRKTANVILLIGFKKKAFPVDTHIFRIGNRLGYGNSEKLIDIEDSFKKYIPDNKWDTAHLLLIHHGRNICKARNPLCTECPVLQHCNWINQN